MPNRPDRKYTYEEKWADALGVMEDLMDEIKAKFSEAHADMADDYEEMDQAAMRVQDQLWELDHGAYDDE